MAKLYFKVGSDWEEVVRLRNEIAKLKQELMSMDGTQSPAAFKALNVQLAASNQRLDELVTNAAKAGAEMETGFKRKIFDASQSVNGFTEKIIAQKNAIGSLQTTIRKNKELYKNIVSRGGEDKELLNHISKQERALGKERDALFNLTQQQAEARLSVKKLRDEYTLYKNDGKQVVETNEGIAISWKKALAVIGGAGVLKALGSEMIRVRGEFQSMHTAIETMVGEDIAGRLIPQIKELAKISPLTMSDMVGAEKMMLGFNIQAEDTIKYLKAISDISMGESSKFNSLTLAFSQMSAAGKLMGQDLNQMINAGFNPLQIISEKTGKSIATLKDEMSKGVVSAEMVQQAFIDATSAGGKFYNMSENASKTINGQLSMMQDALDSVFNELGTKSESVIMDGIQMTTSLIQNYETVGKVLAGLVVTYGTYRTAVMLVTAAESKHTLVEIGLTNARLLARKAQLALNAAMLTNPYVALATVVVGLTATMWAFRDSTTAVEKGTRRYNEEQEKATKLDSERKQKIDGLIQSSRDIALSDLQRGESLAELRSEYPKIFAQYDIESIKLADILQLKQQISKEDAKRAGEEVARNFEAANKAVSDYENALSAKQINGGKLTQQEINKLKELRSYRDQFLVDKGKGISEQFISNLKDVDISEFDRYISELEKSIKGKGKNGTVKLRLPIDIKGTLSDEAIYNVKDIKTLIDTAKSTKQTRIDAEKNKTTYLQDLAKAKEDWEEAKKGYEVLLKDQQATSEQVKKAREDMLSKEKAYKDLGGITGSSLIKQENQAKKEAENRLKQQEQLAEQLLSIRRKNQQDEVNLMEDGTERKLKQIDLDYQRELDAIKKQRREWEMEQGGKLTDKQEEKLGTWASNAAKKRESDIDSTSKAKLEADKKAWQEYFIEFGNYQEKCKNLIQKYNDEIAKLQTDSPEYASKVAQKNKALEQLDEQFGHSTKAMADLFEDASNKSVSAIQSIIDKYETLVKYMSGTDKDISIADLKGMGFTDKDIEGIEKGEISIKDVTDAIKGLKDELKGKSPWQAFVSDLEKGIEAIKKGGNDSKKIGQGITDIGNTVTSFAPALNEFGSSIADIFGFDDSKITSAIDALGGLGQTASGVGQIMSGDIVGGAMSAVSGISAVVSALDGMFGADYSHYNEMVEEYNKLYEIWDELIDKKLEYIGISYGIEADKVGEEALSLVEKQIEAYRLLGKERLNSGASAGSHSIGKRMAKNTSSSDWQDIADALDMSVNAAKEFIGTGRMTGLFDLTVEQLEKLKSEAPAFWAKMDGDVQEYLNGIIDGEERIEDIQNQISEQLTQTTFDSVFDSFVDTLMDMGSSAKDFSDSFSGYMQRAVLTTMVGNKFTEDLQTWYDAFAQANKDQGGITKEEMEALRKQYDAIAGSALAERDKLAEIFGWTKEDTDSSTDNYEDFIGSMQSSLTSLDVTAKDVSDNIYDYFRQAMINALYEKEYKSKMEELYKTFEGLSKDGLSESDMAQLGSQIDQYIEQMMKGVEDVNSLFADKLKNAEDLQSFVDSVKSAMSSVEATAEDVTDNIFEYIRQQMVEKMFADTFQPQIEEFYKRVQKAMSDGDITDAERNTLRSEAEKLANDIVAAKDILSDTLGITESNMKKELEEEFKSFSDDILNSLTNAEVTAEAVAKNISESMRKELIESMYIEQYEPRIKAIWEKWKEYSEDGLVTDEERANIKNDIDELSKEVADAAGEISGAWKDSGEEVRKAFNSFSDSIKSVLYDAEATAEDIADNIYQYMRNALVDSMFTAQLQPQIQAWYDKYTEFMKDGAIDTAERKTLDEMIAEIQKAGVDIVDAANKLFPTLDTGAINRAEEAAQEAENARNEAEQEWESFSDGILNSLYDIEATAEDISDDMSEYMRKALIKAMYVENFKPQMQKWYNEWKKAMGDDDLTSEEKQLLDSMKQTMVDDMKKEVDAINQFFGTMFLQQASSKGFEAMSQDTGEELNGRFTALQVAGEEIKNQSIQQTGLLSSINGKLSLLNLRSGDVPALLSGTPNFADRAKETIASGYQSQVHIVFPTEDIKALTDRVSNMERIVDEMRTFQVEGNMDRRDILENSVILAKNSPRILDNTNDIKQDIKNL
ncbi:tape measure protein [Bacteroides uniformis]|mgnify:CR=1 FL=1|uniref:tape measure protein n=1 Tax=Bacteroides uniformis TaxID=820 RepID=UPI0039B36CE3